VAMEIAMYKQWNSFSQSEAYLVSGIDEHTRCAKKIRQVAVVVRKTSV